MVSNKFYKQSLAIAVCVIFALIMITAASAFSYAVETLNNTITKDDSAYFKITIKNSLEQKDYFAISTRDVNWVINIEEALGAIPPNSEQEFIVGLKPKANVADGKTYFIPVKIESESTGFYFEEREKFAVYVVSPGSLPPGVYVPTVTPVISTDKVIDPRQKVSVKVLIKNRNSRELQDLKIKIDGEVPQIQKEYLTTLLPLEEKMNDILFEVSPLLAPGKKTLKLYLIFENKTIAESSTEYEVLGYDEMKVSSVTTPGLFRKEVSVSIYNNGNKEGIAEHRIKLNFFERLFTKISPQGVKERDKDGNEYYVVRAQLEPKQTLSIKIITDYRLLVGIIIAIIAGIILYYVFRSPIILYKSAEPMGKTTEGLSELKVRIYLKNRSGKSISNIRVSDIIPSIADIKKSPHIGSMDPVNISKGKKGTIARWEYEALEPYEERIIAYKIDSKLKLIGGIRLPNAKARFEAKKGKERVAYSNNVNLIHKTVEEKA